MFSKKKYLFFLLFFLSVFYPNKVFADLSCCSAQGGEYFCDYTTSQLYCKDGTVSTQCACQPVNTPSPNPNPTFTPTPTPTIPPCPNLSSYDVSSGTCKCNAGYVVNNNVCVSYEDFCWTKFGGNSVYDEQHSGCSCAQGYTWNNNQTSCISLNDLCQEKLGNESYYNGDNDTCDCYSGYEVQNNKCQIIPTLIPTISQAEITATTTSTPIPLPTKAVFKPLYPTPTPYLNSNLIPTLGASDVIGIKNYQVVKKNTQNGFLQIFSNIWNFITHIF